MIKDVITMVATFSNGVPREYNMTEEDCKELIDATGCPDNIKSKDLAALAFEYGFLMGERATLNTHNIKSTSDCNR